MDEELLAARLSMSEEDLDTADIPDLPLVFGNGAPSQAAKIAADSQDGHWHAQYTTFAIQPTAPPKPKLGDLWIKTDDLTTPAPQTPVAEAVSLWTGRKWIAVAGGAGGLPVGAVISYAGYDQPDGWLVCNGMQFNASAFPRLATLLGGTNTPNLTDRFVKGAGVGVPLRQTGGSKTIAEAQMPSHSHPVSTSLTAENAHTHTLGINERNNVFAAGNSGTNSLYFTTTTTTKTTQPGSAHSHTATSTASPTGGGQAFEPQYYAMYYIIKAL